MAEKRANGVIKVYCIKETPVLEVRDVNENLTALSEMMIRPSFWGGFSLFPAGYLMEHSESADRRKGVSLE